ncbi:hypothetical protein CDM00_000848 [Salmonella enterica subsp. enterica serovar Javiana]|nr:hypothetical protein [Salmonella enterica subsp. enterica serovar Muenchen]EDX8237936.1 hypothetical protein [Salmonella enterica subsp. enterica serovar Javiana]
MYLRPQVHFLSKPGRTVALFCLAEGLSCEVLVFKLLRTEIAADPDGAGWTLSFLHCTSGPRFTSSASRGAP